MTAVLAEVDPARTRRAFEAYFCGMSGKMLTEMTAQAVGGELSLPSNQLHLPTGYPVWCGDVLQSRWFAPGKEAELKSFQDGGVRFGILWQTERLELMLKNYRYRADLIAYFMHTGPRWLLPMVAYLTSGTDCVAWSAARSMLCIGRRR